jgi:hypothetical protein
MQGAEKHVAVALAQAVLFLTATSHARFFSIVRLRMRERAAWRNAATCSLSVMVAGSGARTFFALTPVAAAA